MGKRIKGMRVSQQFLEDLKERTNETAAFHNMHGQGSIL
jgi:hypothetical protein